MTEQPQKVVVETAPATSGLGIAGLVFSILGWLTCGLLCIPGALLSFLALFSKGPKGAAIAGLIVGFPGVLFFMFVGMGLLAGVLGIGSALNSATAEAERSTTFPSFESSFDRSEPEAREAPNETPDQEDFDSLWSVDFQDDKHKIPESLDLKTIPVDGFDSYGIKVNNSEDRILCEVIFHRVPPSSELASKIVKGVVNRLVFLNADREIVATAIGPLRSKMPDEHFGGKLIYNPDDEEIITEDERNGLLTTVRDEDDYLIIVKEQMSGETMPSDARWLEASIVFQDSPSANRIRKTLLNELAELKKNDKDFQLRVFQGDKLNAISWEKLRGPSGEPVSVKFNHSTGETESSRDWREPKTFKKKVKYESRTWTDASGTFSVEAKLVYYKEGQVTIRREDGGIKTLPLDKLSEADKAYISSLHD